MNERQLVISAKDNLATAKDALRSVERAARQVAQINREADRGKAANVAMRFEGKVRQALGLLIEAHADMSDGLIEHWPDFDAEVTTRGGGR